MKIHKKSLQENDLTTQTNISLNAQQLYSSGVTVNVTLIIKEHCLSLLHLNLNRITDLSCFNHFMMQ